MFAPGFYEFFCGGGMARAGLGQDWRCLFANDFDEGKAASYRRNWGAGELRVADIASLSAQDLPPGADLAWASFPCQDLSLAGEGAGLQGGRSGAFWRFHGLMQDLKRQRRLPNIIALENVLGALSANGGADFVALCTALQSLDCVVGALTLDAAWFTPQSRPRLFIVAAARSAQLPARLTGAGPCAHLATPALLRSVAALPARLARDWRWWTLPAPPKRNLELTQILETDPADAPHHSAAETQAFLAQMSAPALRKLDAARRTGAPQVGALFRRTRRDGEGRSVVRAELRFDGLAGCLRTPGGGSSRQFLIEVSGPATRSRLISAREAARLMGLPDSYSLPERRNAAYHLLGDGVVAPAVNYLAQHLLTPMALAARATAEQAA